VVLVGTAEVRVYVLRGIVVTPGGKRGATNLAGDAPSAVSVVESLKTSTTGRDRRFSRQEGLVQTLSKHLPFVFSAYGFTILIRSPTPSKISCIRPRKSGCAVRVLRLPIRAIVSGGLIAMNPFSQTYSGTVSPLRYRSVDVAAKDSEGEEYQRTRALRCLFESASSARIVVDL
jgi:hypothetical protein